MIPSIPCISFRGPLSIPHLELKLAPVFPEKGLLLWYPPLYSIHEYTLKIHAISSQQIFLHPGRVLEFLAEAEAERARLWYQMSVTWL